MTEQANQPFAFNPENLEKAKAIIAKYPEGRQASACMPLLDLAQRQNNNFLSTPAMDCVAEMLDMPPIRVYEVATFYTMFNIKPVGTYHVQICTNISCMLRGSDEVMAKAKDVLNISTGETSEDGKFTLTEVECLGACVNAPMMQINDDYYEDLDALSTANVLSQLKQGQTPPPGPQSGRKGPEPAAGLTTLCHQQKGGAA